MNQPLQMNGGSTTGTGVAATLGPGLGAGVPLVVPHQVQGMPYPGHPGHIGPHAQLNGGSKTGMGVKRVPPPVRTVSLPGAAVAGKSTVIVAPDHQDTVERDSSTRGRCSPRGLFLDVLKLYALCIATLLLIVEITSYARSQNLGVCMLVVLYLLMGAFVFLAMNEDLWDPQVVPVVSGPSGTNASAVGLPEQHLTSLQLAIQESRTRTIERIWDITVNLNILYRDNWTELAGREIERFQQQLMARLSEESRRERRADPGGGVLPLSGAGAVSVHRPRVRAFHHHSVRWNFAQAFLFSLTVISTIGYGSFTPLTPVGKAVTMGYAALGTPLMLLYLSAVGGLLARCARGVFTRAVCCCLCSKCGYCCYDEERMQEKERRLRRKREELEMKMSSAPYYVRADPPAYSGHALGPGSGRGPTRPFSGSVLAPVLLCGSIMMVYVMGGALALWGMRAFQFLDCVFFCFMSLTTIGFGNLIPGAALPRPQDIDLILWFCSGYILIGMALTTMCCNVVYSVLLHAIRHASAVARASAVAGKH